MTLLNKETTQLTDKRFTCRVSGKSATMRKSSCQKKELHKRPNLILHRRVGAMSEKQRAKLGPTFLGGLVQRSEGPTVSGIHRCVAFDEQGCDLDVSIR